MGRYAVMRLLVFFGCLVGLWLLGMRSKDDQLLLVLSAAVLSALISWFLLRRPREEMSERIAERVEHRKLRHNEDEDVEDSLTAPAPNAAGSDQDDAVVARDEAEQR